MRDLRARIWGTAIWLVMGFVLPTGRPRPNCASEWVAIPLPVYQELMELLNDKNKKGA